MISPRFNYAQMEILCAELQKRVGGFTVTDCLPNDLHRFFLIFGHHNQQEALFFYFSPLLMRFHLSQLHSIPKTQESHPLLPFLKGATLIKAQLLQEDRILQLDFTTSAGRRTMIAEFFSKHPNYYLLDPNGKILFAMHHQHNRTHYQLPPKPSLAPQSPPQWASHQEVEQAYLKLEKELEFETEKHSLETFLAKEIKNLQRKERKLVETLEECSEWEIIQHEGELIKAHFGVINKGMSSVTVHDWLTDQSYELKFDPTKTAQEEMAARFKKAKKLQAGITPLTQQLERTRDVLNQIQKTQYQLKTIQTYPELQSFKTKHFPAAAKKETFKRAVASQAPFYREFLSAKGIKIWVGKNAKVNEQLTFRLANGRDWWLHVSGYPGSHVIIRVGKDEQPDQETLLDAMQLALVYSKAKEQKEGEVCYTQRKYVSRLGKGKTGQVQISKQQSAWVRFDPVRYNAIKERKESEAQSENTTPG